MPENTRIYWEKPLVYFPTTQRGQPAKRPQVLGVSYLVKDLVDHSKTEWFTLLLRTSERGLLTADFARHRVWTAEPDGTHRQEWLLIRRDPSQLTYSVSNAPVTTSLLTMA